MYYLYSDSGELIDIFGASELEAAKASKLSITDSILIYWDGAIINNDTPWELGIEIEGWAPKRETKFYYEFGHHMGGYIKRYNSTLEEALESLKKDKEEYPKGFFSDKIEEMVVVWYKVKL